MSESKADKVSRFIERHVHDALADVALRNPSSAEWLKGNARCIEIEVSSRVTRPYGMIELADIMKWKKPRDI